MFDKELNSGELFKTAKLLFRITASIIEEPGKLGGELVRGLSEREGLLMSAMKAKEGEEEEED